MAYCEHCARREHPDFRQRWQDFGRVTDDGRFFVWSIPLAQAIIRLRAAYRQPVEMRTLTPDELQDVIRVHEINPEHIKHLPATATEEPGIAVTLLASKHVSEIYIIDGSHRAARCLAEGRPFRVYVLNRTESEIALLQVGGEVRY
ncbi:hypothetical protein EKD04_023990 [Chloroflexales bacterium ZM16-3]|nr:hypothetical protein [Chloroflexales bacterium ZM16-3]